MTKKEYVFESFTELLETIAESDGYSVNRIKHMQRSIIKRMEDFYKHNPYTWRQDIEPGDIVMIPVDGGEYAESAVRAYVEDVKTTTQTARDGVTEFETITGLIVNIAGEPQELPKSELPSNQIVKGDTFEYDGKHWRLTNIIDTTIIAEPIENKEISVHEVQKPVNFKNKRIEILSKLMDAHYNKKWAQLTEDFMAMDARKINMILKQAVKLPPAEWQYVLSKPKTKS